MNRKIVRCPDCHLEFRSGRPATYCPGCHNLVEPIVIRES